MQWRTDIICLTDENVLSLSIPEDLAGLKKFYRYNFAFFHSPQPGLYRVLPRTSITRSKRARPWPPKSPGDRPRCSSRIFEARPVVDPERCRGCGRCVDMCPFDAIHLRANVGTPIRPRSCVTTAWGAAAASAAVRSPRWTCPISPTGSWRRSSAASWKEAR